MTAGNEDAFDVLCAHDAPRRCR